MVTIQETKLKEGIRRAISKAKSLSMPILFSEVQEISHIDPITFFRAGTERYEGERFFWKDPSDESFFVGVGICNQFGIDQEKRFAYIDTEWKNFIEEAIIVNPYNKSGIGPMIFGGFSFDPLKEKTKLWEKYYDALFHVPKYMVSILQDRAYLTTNIVCSKHDDETLADKLHIERKMLLSFSKHSTQEIPQKVKEKREVAPEEWKETVSFVTKQLTHGPLNKVVLARELRLFFEHDIEIDAVVSRLLQQQSDSYTFAFESNGDCFIGATPERLVKKEESSVLTTCIAGSIARGKSSHEDEDLGQALLTDPKNMIEHQYVVDMIKEVMEDLCEEVVIPSRVQLLKLKYIQHLHTPVKGIVNRSTSLLEFVERLHPTPALGGQPKELAVEKIREVEILDRGFYGAPLGWIDYQGNGEFAVAIRSGLIQGKEASIFAGCGVVKDSDADSEYEETNIKFKPMLNALGGKNI